VGDSLSEGQLYFVLPEYARRHPQRAEAYADAVAEIEQLRDKVDQVRSRGWSGWPALPLRQASALSDGVIRPVDVATIRSADEG
jgi:hypothetical protein